MFLLFVVARGRSSQAQAVLDFGDLMILGMAFPNVLGVVMLSGVVRRDLEDYLGRLRSGEMRPNP